MLVSITIWSQDPGNEPKSFLPKAGKPVIKSVNHHELDS